MNIFKELATSIVDDGINDCVGLLKVIGNSSSITQERLRKITRLTSKQLNEYLTNLSNIGLLNVPPDKDITLTENGKSIYDQLKSKYN